MTEGTLHAGQGYIIQASKQTVLTMKAGYGNLNAAFTPYAVSTPLNEWPSALGAPEAGWNFVGNPYPTYFDIRHMDFSAPITVWNGSTYAAYSVADDELALKPLQPFFVQCPAGTERITFNTAGRQTTATIDHSRLAAPRDNGGAYTFAIAEGGNVSGRFFLVLAAGTTGICTTVKADDTAGTTVYYTADGRRAGTDAGMLPAGVYVKKDNKGNAVKVIVR